MFRFLWPSLSLTLLALASSCAPKASNSALSEARLEASEAKISKLEERLASLEEKTSKLDGVAEGVEMLLDTIAAEGGPKQKKRPRPSSTAIYSMPIDGDPYVGPALAKVTLVKGYDFYCGFCDRALPTMVELQKIYGDKLKIVFKNFVIHDDYARLPALAACAAHKQNRFMPMFEQIWIHGMRARAELTEAKLVEIATALKLNKKRFLGDMYGSCEDKVRSDFQSMEAVGATGTPVFYINGRFLSGALPIEKYRRIIDQELVKAEAALKSGIALKNYYPNIVKTGRKSL